MRYPVRVKIICDTPERLVFESRPVFWAYLVVAATVALGAAAIAALRDDEPGVAMIIIACIAVVVAPILLATVERVTVSFDVRTQSCTWRRRSLRRDTTTEIPLDAVRRAMVQTCKGDSECEDAHRVALVIGTDTLENRHALTRFHISGTAAPKAVRRINGWLEARRRLA